MDFAYDQIAARTYSNDRSTTPRPQDSNDENTSTSTTPTRQHQRPERQNLQTEFQETFKAFSNSPWGTKLGGWWSTARTQGVSYYETARKEAERREAEAAKALEEARKIVVERTKVVVEAAESQLDTIVNNEETVKREASTVKLQTNENTTETDSSSTPSTTTDDTDTFLARFKSEAAKRLKEVQQAEDAADEALLRFGSNLRSFLKDAVSVTAPTPANNTSTEVLFESQDATTGKRVIHTSRFEAQLHVIHTTASSFTSDPEESDGQWEDFKKQFDIAKETNAIAKDLDKYPELRTAMERYVPEKVEYKDFWTRYYFLRHVVEVQEEKRKELLKASTLPNIEEEVAWDEEDSDSEAPASGSAKPATTVDPSAKSTATAPSTTTADTSSSHARTDSDAITLRAPRRSHDEKSVADSEASYDLVSGAVSRSGGSPKVKAKDDGEESDDDWE